MWVAGMLLLELSSQILNTESEGWFTTCTNKFFVHH